MATRAFDPFITYFNANKAPAAGHKFYFYEVGTNTLKTVYDDQSGTTPIGNPVVVLNSGQLPEVFIDGSYRVVWKDSNNKQLKEIANFGGETDSQLGLYSTTKLYNSGDLVTGSDGYRYQSIVDNNINNDPTTSPTLWVKVQFVIYWNILYNFNKNDLAQGGDGLTYASLVDNNLGNDPVTDSGANWLPSVRIYRAGDVITSADSTNYTTPEWLPCDGAEFDDTVYTNLATLIDPWYAKLADPSDLPNFGTGTSGRPVCFSKTDDTYLAVAHNNSPYVTIYKRSGDTFTKLANPATLPPNSNRNCDFDATDTYLANAHDNSPYVTIYKKSGDTFTKLANPATLPAGNGRGVRFSPTTNYLSFAGITSPYMAVYSRSGDTFTKLADPATLPTGIGQDTCVDSTDTYFMIAHQTSPYISIYSRSGSTLTKLANPATLPPGNCFACDVDSTDTYWAVGSNASPYLAIYKRSGSTFTKINNANISEFPTDAAASAKFTDSTTLYITTPTEVHKYIRSGDVFTKVAEDFVSSDLTGGSQNGTDFSQSGTYSAIGLGVSPYVNIYKKDTYVTPDIDADTNSHADAYIKTGE